MNKSELLANFASHINDSDWKSCTDSFGEWKRRLASARPVSVVVPIFNGLTDVKRMLESKSLWDFAAEVILIDDHSSDPAIVELLEDVASQHVGFRVIRNPRNLGFVRTVNIGIKERQPFNDVVVLNSDALPDGDWIERLRAVAYARPNVATVSPLSNSAGFFSLPKPNQVNIIPNDFSAENCSQLLGWIAPRLYEQTIATCGFCWYVRSEVLEQIGSLDEYLFHRGYAEETDFCLRASEQGFIHLCSLTAYVGHGGAQSFKGEKETLKKNNANILKAINPKFIELLREYEQKSLLHDLGNLFEECLPGSGKESHKKDVVFDFGYLNEQEVNLRAEHGRLVLDYSEFAQPIELDDSDQERLDFYLSARLCPKKICN